MPRPLDDRFWSKVDKSGDCWLWKGKRSSNYGVFHMRGRRQATHVAWLLTHGEWPARGLFVLHSCDNPPCVNPAHLRVGTPADNNADTVARGRLVLRPQAGEANPQAKLTAASVALMRERRAAGERGVDLARAFGVCGSLVSQITTGKRWSHL